MGPSEEYSRRRVVVRHTSILAYSQHGVMPMDYAFDRITQRDSVDMGRPVSYVGAVVIKVPFFNLTTDCHCRSLARTVLHI